MFYFYKWRGVNTNQKDLCLNLMRKEIITKHKIASAILVSVFIAACLASCKSAGTDSVYLKTKATRNDGTVVEWSYDKNGYEIGSYTYDTDGNMTTREEVFYSDDYTLAEHFEYKVDGEEEALAYHYSIEYQDGKIVRKSTFASEESVEDESTFITLYEYNDDNDYVVQTSELGDGSYKKVEEFDYCNGEFFYTKGKVYDYANNDAWKEEEFDNSFEFDEDGNLIKCIIKGKNYSGLDCVEEYSYDEFNNRVKTIIKYDRFADMEDNYDWEEEYCC